MKGNFHAQFQMRSVFKKMLTLKLHYKKNNKCTKNLYTISSNMYVKYGYMSNMLRMELS